jgi:very-short-patch-repair endonuclease
VDSWEFHKTRAAFERDRTRDAALLVGGYRVARITFLQLRDDPAAVATTIRALLAKPA